MFMFTSTERTNCLKKAGSHSHTFYKDVDLTQGRTFSNVHDTAQSPYHSHTLRTHESAINKLYQESTLRLFLWLKSAVYCALLMVTN